MGRKREALRCMDNGLRNRVEFASSLALATGFALLEEEALAEH